MVVLGSCCWPKPSVALVGGSGRLVLAMVDLAVET